MHADFLAYHLTVAEYHERRDAHNAEALSDSRLIIDIQLADLDLAVKLLVKLLKDRCLHAAGSAPSCPEVDQHEAGGSDGIKIVLCKMHNSHVIYLLCYSLLI